MGNCLKPHSNLYDEEQKIDLIISNWMRIASVSKHTASYDLIILIYEHAKYTWFEETALKILSVNVLNDKKMQEYYDDKLNEHCKCDYISKENIVKLCKETLQLFSSEPVLFNLKISKNQKLIIFGSIRGDLKSLLRHFDSIRPENGDTLGLNIIQKIQKYNDIYLFLGDYVCRGNYQTECIVLLYCLKIMFPKNIYLLRGRYEDGAMLRWHGFYRDIELSFPRIKGHDTILKHFEDTFDMMPFIALIHNKWFCVHGGLSLEITGDKLNDLNDLNSKIQKPAKILDNIAGGLLRSTPSHIGGWYDPGNLDWEFGPDVINSFLARHNLDMIVTGDLVLEDGFEWSLNGKLMEVFSSENYVDMANDGAIVIVDHELEFKVKCLNDPKTYVSQELVNEFDRGPISGT